MMIGNSPPFVFTGITKTATQTMFAVLSRYYGGRLDDNVNAHSVEIPEYARDRFTFTVCRNPYDRAVSLWWSTTQIPDEVKFDRYGFRAACPNPDDFTAFARWLATDAPEHELTRTQAAHVAGVRLDAVLRFESLAEDFNRLPFYRGEPKVWPRENQTINERGPWQDYMTDEARRWVLEWCADDFNRFGYQR